MSAFEDDLKDLNAKKPRYGACKKCGKLVFLSKDKINSHKRANCIMSKSSKKEADFGGSVVDNDPGSSTSTTNKMTQYVDKVTAQEKKFIDTKVAEFIFCSGSAFRMVDLKSFKALMKALRPAYVPPSAKSLATKLLEEVYCEQKLEFKKILLAAPSFVLVSDGWTNISHQHLINFVIVFPGQKRPLFWKMVDTTGYKNDAQTLARLVIETAKELDVDKWTGLITDNASVMQKVADIIEEKYPHVFANGCLSHGINLLIKNICELPEIKELLGKTNAVITFINDHARLRLKYYKNIAPLFKNTKVMNLAIETRFYSMYTQAKDVLDHKNSLRHLFEENLSILNEQNKYQVEAVRKIIASSKFWNNLKILVEILEPLKEAISFFEADEPNIEYAYFKFQSIKELYRDLTVTDEELVSSDSLLKLLMADWNFMHSEVMGYAHILAPRFLDKKMEGSDFEDSVTGLKKHCLDFYKLDEEGAKLAQKQIDEYFRNFQENMSDVKKELMLKRDTKAYWSMEGNSKYPQLAKIARRIYTLPTSSAASERAWSSAGFLHNKRRNRLKPETQDKLNFVYRNMGTLEDIDLQDMEDFMLLLESEEDVQENVVEIN